MSSNVDLTTPFLTPRPANVHFLQLALDYGTIKIVLFGDRLIPLCKFGNLIYKKYKDRNSRIDDFVIGHVRYISILTWLRGFQVKPLYLVLFSLYLSLFWELKDMWGISEEPTLSLFSFRILISQIACRTRLSEVSD